MAVHKMTITGFRGFAQEQSLRFAQPTGEVGSGITILVGPNNGGKSSVIESLRAWSGQDDTSFSEGKRNKLADDRVSILIKLDDGLHELSTVDAGGSQTVRQPNYIPTNCYVLPSRRFFDPYFRLGQSNREEYLRQQDLPETRTRPIISFHGRLFNALQNRTEFNRVLERVVSPAPTWTIDQSDQGEHYLKVNSDGQYHSSDGLGEGLVSLLFIVDALYDSSPGDLIVIDEPELSLHPTYQRRLANLLADYSRDRQIVYATHSPYFVDFNHVLNGAEVARIHRRDGMSLVSQLSGDTAKRLEGLLRNSHNPHLLGIDAREVFFKEDGVVIVEGQEDVVYYPKVLEDLERNGRLSTDGASFLEERFFGWGSGGAGNIERIAGLLYDLGFERVAGILDGNKCDVIPSLQAQFPTYIFLSIPADDIRTKPALDSREPIFGLLDEDYALRPELAERTGDVFKEIMDRLS